jgi:hypothetical protein
MMNNIISNNNSTIISPINQTIKTRTNRINVNKTKKNPITLKNKRQTNNLSYNKTNSNKTPTPDT